MKVELKAVLGCDTALTARSLAAVLSSDNRVVPTDQVLLMSRSKNRITLTIEGRRPASAFSSLDSVLADAALFQEIWLLSRRQRAQGRR